jgi:hypothetical protein
MIYFSDSLLALASSGVVPTGNPVRRWVELTTENATYVTFQNIGTETVYVKGTSGAIAPIDANGSLEFPPASQAVSYLLSDMFPGISGVNRLWAYADAETFVMISHAPSTNKTVVVAPSLGAEDLNAPVFGYRNFVTAANVSATSNEAGYPASNLANVSTASFWRASSTDMQYITAAISPAQVVDYVGIARHNFQTAGVTVSVETQEGLGDPWVEVISPFIPSDNAALIFRFASQVAYGVRVKLASSSSVPQAAVMYVGKLLSSTQRVYVGHSPITLNRQVEVVSGLSESGNYLGRIVTGSNLTTSVSLTHLKPDWYRVYFDPFVREAETVPFFFAWRPLQYPKETSFAWLTNNPQPSNMLPNGMMQVSLEMSGVAA